MKKVIDSTKLFFASLSVILSYMAPVFLMAAGLAGCSTEPKYKPLDDTLLPPTTKTVNIPKDLLVKCKPIPTFEVKDYPKDEFVKQFSKQVVDSSEECRLKHATLVDTVIKAFNIQPEHPSK